MCLVVLLRMSVLVHTEQVTANCRTVDRNQMQYAIINDMVQVQRIQEQRLNTRNYAIKLVCWNSGKHVTCMETPMTTTVVI